MTLCTLVYHVRWRINFETLKLLVQASSRIFLVTYFFWLQASSRIDYMFGLTFYLLYPQAIHKRFFPKLVDFKINF